MHALSESDVAFRSDFDRGSLPPAEFNHSAHLRLAYIHLATYGIAVAERSFKESLLAYLNHHGIDASKFHETLTRAWLQAVWHFMQRAQATTSSDDLLRRSEPLLDPAVMLTHYSKDVLFSADARQRHVSPDISPIPDGSGTS